MWWGSSDQPKQLYLQEFQVEDISEYINPGNPDIRLALIKYIGIDGWTFEPGLSFSVARCAELGLHPYDTDRDIWFPLPQPQIRITPRSVMLTQKKGKLTSTGKEGAQKTETTGRSC